MNPYQFEVTCDVCGGEAMATSRGAAASWLEGCSVRHIDPGVCAATLARKKAELDRRETELNSKEKDDA